MAHRDRKPAGMLPLSTLESLVVNEHSQVIKKTSKIHMGLSPGCLSNIKQGLEAQLLPQLNRYYPALGAILLGWDDLRLCAKAGLLMADSPAVHVDITGNFYVFSPEVGSVLQATVNKKSAGHIGCLVHETFNISLMSDTVSNFVHIGDTIMIEVTKLFWGHRSLPIIQGKLISDKSEDIDDGGDKDYDSGIDSTVTGVVLDQEQEQEVTICDTSETKQKKGKKRKKDELDESSQDASNLMIVDSVNSPAKKKKKKKKKDND